MVVITDANQSPAAELRQRQTRYVLMMLARAACLVIAAVLAMLQVPLLALWVVLCLIGAVVLPWLAVVLANDRAPKRRYRRSGGRRHPPVRMVDHAPSGVVAEPGLTARREPVVIDAER